MTYEEAIETIKLAIAEVEWNYPMNYVVAFEEAIKALEKQIPKKPIDTQLEYGGYKEGFCPVCQADMNNDMHYCDVCGQKLNWSDKKNDT